MARGRNAYTIYNVYNTYMPFQYRTVRGLRTDDEVLTGRKKKSCYLEITICKWHVEQMHRLVNISRFSSLAAYGTRASYLQVKTKYYMERSYAHRNNIIRIYVRIGPT